MILFAYGSNMCGPRLRARVPSARFIGPARLDGYLLRFHKRSNVDGSGKATVRRGGEDDHVWGVLFECEPGDKPLLDVAEGLGVGYREIQAVVHPADGGDPVAALLYIAQPSHLDDSLQPFGWYMEFIVAGAEEHALPEEYVEMLRGQVAGGDPNEARAARNRAILAGS